jgi:signal transduction histidine kinase
MAESSERDARIAQYIKATEQLKQGQFDLEVPASPLDDVGRLGQALRDLARVLELRYREVQKIEKITAQINAGVLLDDILEIVYRDFRELIPYNRIGLSLIEDDGQTVRARWAKTDQPHMTITAGYASSLAGSSLDDIIRTGQPRILNDLEEYLRLHPQSASTHDILSEGIRSSLTCPLIANGVPIGFIFFSSASANIYSKTHVATFNHVAEQLSIIVEKGRLVSEIAAQKAAIEQQNEELRHLSELKDSFLGMAAHDLRTPITVIQLAVGLMLDYGAPLSDEERTSFLRDIKRQSDHMLALLNDLLDVTEIEAGHLSLDRQPIDLADFLQDATAWHRKLAAPKGTQIILEDVPAGSAQADALRLRQVVDNLISNAVKYSPPGSQVWVRAERTADSWRIHVKDQGPGITPKDRQRLFQDFARLSAKPTGGEKSTGLGLAITHRVVAAHDGQIGVDSEPGQGADFWFTLPDDVSTDRPPCP